MNDVCNSIIDGISIKLDEIFNQDGDKYEIYGEEIKQGLKEPCFFIKLLKSSQNQVVRNRYFRRQSFDIHYFPESSIQAEKEMLNIADKLYETLEYIKCENDIFRGTEMNHEIVDNVLHFFVDYNFYTIKKTEDTEYIKEFEYKQEVKNEESN